MVTVKTGKKSTDVDFQVGKTMLNSVKEERKFVSAALAVRAHPLWGRICWRLLEDAGALDTNELMDRGVDQKNLWDPELEFTYFHWWTLLEYAYENLGPRTGVDLAVVGHHYPAPFTEALLHTAPDVRTYFHFWENTGIQLDITHVFLSKKIRGGMTFTLDYQMGGTIEQAFSLSCIAILSHCIRTLMGRGKPVKFEYNFELPPLVKTYAEVELGVVLKKAKGHKASIALTLTDEELDQPAVGSDPMRYAQNLVLFQALIDAMRNKLPNVDLADRVTSVQLTTGKPLSMEQMADRMGLKVENYRKKLSLCGTSHRTITHQCVRHNAEKMIQLGHSQNQVAKKMGITQQRLKRHLSETP